MQDLCVRITSPESLVQLVDQMHQAENNARQQVREYRIQEAVKQAEKVGFLLLAPVASFTTCTMLRAVCHSH